MAPRDKNFVPPLHTVLENPADKTEHALLVETLNYGFKWIVVDRTGDAPRYLEDVEAEDWRVVYNPASGPIR